MDPECTDRPMAMDVVSRYRHGACQYWRVHVALALYVRIWHIPLCSRNARFAASETVGRAETKEGEDLLKRLLEA